MLTANHRHLDYLVIGHITEDVIDGGFVNGGTVSYSSLTAKAFSLETGIITAGASDITHLPVLTGISVHQKPSPYTTTFKNIYTPSGRKQFLLNKAELLTVEDVPEQWLSSAMVHLGPMAQEIDESFLSRFPAAFIGATPQGWMRSWDDDGLVSYSPWTPSAAFLKRVDAVVLSIEDVLGNEDVIDDLARKLDVLVVTEGYNGARVYWRGDVRRFNAPQVDVVDPTGAGDIFAAVFFIRLHATRDPWHSAMLAVELASLSVSRRGLEGIPTKEEINSAMVELFKES